jgi:hypothetical protein
LTVPPFVTYARVTRSMNTMDKLLEAMRTHLVEAEADIENLSAEMELLDMNSKDYAELEYEYNYLSGQATITRYYLSVANGSID